MKDQRRGSGSRAGRVPCTPVWLLGLGLLAAACGGAAAKTSTGASSPSPSPTGRFRGAGVTGSIVSVTGSTVLVNLRTGGTATIDTSSATVVMKTVTSTVSSIQPNTSVLVTGPLNADGTYTANAIVVIPAGTFGGAGAGGFGGGGGAGGFSPRPRPTGSFATTPRAIGTVAGVSGANLTLTTTAGSTVTVVTSPSTTVSETETGTLADLTPGTTIVVTGPKNPDGSYTATRITIGGAGTAAGGLGGFFGRGAGSGATG